MQKEENNDNNKKTTTEKKNKKKTKQKHRKRKKVNREQVYVFFFKFRSNVLVARTCRKVIKKSTKCKYTERPCQQINTSIILAKNALMFEHKQTRYRKPEGGLLGVDIVVLNTH